MDDLKEWGDQDEWKPRIYIPTRYVYPLPKLKVGDKVAVRTCYQYSANSTRYGVIVKSDAFECVIEYNNVFKSRDYLASSEYYRVIKSDS